MKPPATPRPVYSGRMPLTPSAASRVWLTPLRITLLYLALGAAWILLSDRVLALLPVDRATALKIETVKGWLFVAVTAAVIYALLERRSRQLGSAHEELLRTVEPYRLMVEETSDYAIFMIDLDGRITTWNAGAQRLYGFSAGEIVGSPVARLYPGEGAEFVAHRELEQAALGARHSSEGWRIRKDGERFWISCVTTALRDQHGALRGYARLVRDMTERRNAEQRLRESEQRYRKLVEEAPIGIIVNEGGRFAYANAEAARLLGAEAPQELLGTPVIDRIHPSAHAIESERIGILQQGGEVPTIPEVWVRLDGVLIDVSVAAAPITYGGRPVFQVLIHDETARRRAEAALLEAKNTLEQRVEERTADLQRLNAELQSFTYSVSHDLRAPIRHIDGFARMLEEREALTLSPDGRRYLATMRSSAQRMGALIDDLLRLSRLGRDTLHPTDVDMDAMVRAVWDELTSRGGSAPITLDLRPLPPARADAPLLRQVWQNLLDNAIKYSSKSDAPRITIDAVPDDGRLWYRVSDNGVGFDPRYAGKMFAVFQRLHRPDEFPGTGVGLAIAKKVVDLHGGQIRARGEPGRGAVFEFSLGGG